MVVDVARGKLWWETRGADLVAQENAPVVNKVTTLVNQYMQRLVCRRDKRGVGKN